MNGKFDEPLDGPTTESFGFKLSKGLRQRLGEEAAKNRRTVGAEVVARLIASLENADSHDALIPASPVAKEALDKANANEARIALLEARVALLEKPKPKG